MEGLETKEIALVKQQANKVIKEVEELKITSAPTLEKAKVMLSSITDNQKILKGIREEMTKPINEGLSKIRAFFSPVEDNLGIANKELKWKMSVYNEKIKIEVEQKKKQIAEKVENGDTSFKKASKQMERAEKKVEAMPTRKHRDIEIIDESKIPDKYWELNIVTLRRDALSGIEISGIKVVEREIIVSR